MTLAHASLPTRDAACSFASWVDKIATWRSWRPWRFLLFFE